MIISSLLDREKLSPTSKIRCIWTPANKTFEDFTKHLNIDLLYINDLYYGNNIPDIVICNNKIDHYNECYSISRRLQLPVLLIDHIPRNPLFDIDKIKIYNQFPCSHHVCINKSIKDSWLLEDNIQILSYNSYSKESIQIWNNLIFQTSKKIFTI